MKNKLLLLGFVLTVGISFSQDVTSLKKQIADKELSLEKAVASSRQVNNTLKEELKELYLLYKAEIENELKSISNEALISAKKEELTGLNEKIENYSSKK